MAAELVTAIYRPKAGKADALEALIAEHVPLLRERGLATDRTSTVMRCASDGTLIEIFEWVDEQAAHKAHTDEAVGPFWGRINEVADYIPWVELAEALVPFPHFEPVDALAR